MAPLRRRIVWVKDDPFGVEHADVILGRSTMSATGVAIGTDPAPYRLDYRLETRRGFVTSRLLVETKAQGWRRRLDLRRSSTGVWTVETQSDGAAALPPPGGDAALFANALDCDLGLSPLTNTMPVLRHGLHTDGGPGEFTMAWVSVPDLSVRPSVQRYTFIKGHEERRTVRFEDDDGFSADITLDGDGLVLDYPGLARRLG